MKKTRALTMILAASMLLSLFPVMTSAASEYNYIKIEEEVIIENGNFDKKPVIKNDQGRAYHTQTPGTWSYQYNTPGTALAEYAKDGDNGYIKVTAANVNPSVAYAFGEVKKGDYKLTLDVCPESGSNVDRIVVQVFYNLDSDFNVGNTAYRLITKDFTLTKGTYNTISVDVRLADDTKLAFRVYSLPDNPANGSFSIDNVSLGRPADVLIETADLDAVDASKAYTGVSDTTLPAGKWVATDNTKLQLDNSGSYIAANKNDSDIPDTPSVVYTFPDTYNAGKYRLTFDVLSEEVSGAYQIADVSTDNKWNGYTATQSTPVSITGGKRYSAEFTVTADNTALAFRYYQNANKLPSKPFSIDNVKLEMLDVGATYWETVESNDFTAAPNYGKLGGSWTPGTAGTWGVKGSSANTTVSHNNGKMVFNNANEQAGVAYRFPANLSVGKYRLNFTLTYNTTSSVNTKLCVFKNSTGTNILDTSFTLASSLAVSKEFDNTDATGTYYFRFYPNQTSNQPTVYTVDDYSLERSVSGKWVVKYDSETAAAPTVKTDVGVNYNNSKDYKNTWFVRYNGNAIGAIKLDYTNGKLNATARDTAIHAKPAVMYRFNNTLAKGNYSVEVTIKTSAQFGDGDKYTLAVYDTEGNVKASQEQTLAANSEAVTVPLNFTLDSDTDIILSIQSTKPNGDAKYTNAFEIQGATVSKLSNPLVQLRSNADLATFDSDEGVYYMAVNAQRDIYLNYFANTDLRSGQYMLSAEFKTAADQNVQLFANFGIMDLDVNTIQAGDEWQHIEYPVTIKRDTGLSISNGIRFKVNSTEPLYMRNLKFIFVEELPKPAINSAITMILLKKIEGTYAGHISTKPVEYAVNGGFDTEINIDHEQSRAYLKHEDGRWSYSKNAGDVKASIVKDGASSYAYFEVANANPTVGHRIGTLPAGRYTLSFDIYPEYNIGNIRTRIFKLTDGFAVGKTEYVIADNTASIKVGANNTITYNFVLPEETTVAFNFYATKENPCPEKGNFRLDNVSVIGRP